MSDEAAPASAAPSERVQLETMMADRESAYWKGAQAPALQERYRSLLEAGEGNAAAPAVSGREAEIAALEADMRRDINAWHKDDGKRARLLALYEAREGGAVDDGGDMGPADDAERHASIVYDIPQLSSGLLVADFEDIVSAPWANTLASEWGERFPVRIAEAQRGAVDLLSTLPPDYQHEMIEIFDALPVRTQAKILKRLAGAAR